MPEDRRVSENEVADAVLVILASGSSGQASIADLVKELPQHLDLSTADRTPSKTRHNEELWEQQVRNITSHQKSPGNFICEGYLESVKGGLSITERGRSRVDHKKH